MTENCKTATGKFLTSKLSQRYGIIRSVVDQRLEALCIKPIGVGNKSYITPDELQLMDDLDDHLEAGGKTEEFVSEGIEAGSSLQPVAPSTANESAIVHSSPEAAAIARSSEYSGAARNVKIEASASAVELIIEQSQKASTLEAEDIAEVDKRSQQRAYAMATAEDTLTAAYLATENFTIPGMKEQLERHRRACRQAMDRGTVNYLDDHLNKVLERFKIVKSGSPGSQNSNKDRSDN